WRPAGCKPVPLAVLPHLTRTIPVLFRRAVDDAGDRTWLLAEGVSYTYAQAGQRVARAASGLRAAGVGSGDRVLVTAKNTPSFLLNWLALMDVGAIQVPVNPKSTTAELAGFLTQVEPRAVVTDDDLTPSVDAAL